MKTKLLLILVTTLSSALTKQAETKAEKFECIAKNLRDKNLLDTDFRFSESSQTFDCEAVITEHKENILRDKLNLTSLKEEGEGIIAVKKLVQDNSACIRDELISSEYPEVMMKISVYELSQNLVMKQRKQLAASAKTEGDKKMKTAIIKCITGPIFSELFDNTMTDEDEQTLEDHQVNYCMRKLVVERNLINTSEFPVTLNPENIEINFDCVDRIKTATKTLEEVLKETYKGIYKSEVQLQCLTKVIITEKLLDYTAKAFVLSEINLPEDKKNRFRSEFADNLRPLSEEMAKCI